MNEDLKWFATADLSEYKGNYVAILDKRIIASGTDAKKVWETAKRKSPNRTPALAKIPEKETLILSVSIGFRDVND